MKRIFGFVTLLITGCALPPNHPPCHATPDTFCSVFARIDDSIPESDKAKFRVLREQDLASVHFGFGMFLRNSLHLWQENELTRYFRSIGVEHPDAMSYVLTRGYIAYLNGLEVSMPSLVPKPPPPPPPQPNAPAHGP